MLLKLLLFSDSFFTFRFVSNTTQPGLLYVHVFVASNHNVWRTECNKIK